MVCGVSWIAEADVHLQRGAGPQRSFTALPGSQAWLSSTPSEQQVTGSALLAWPLCLHDNSLQPDLLRPICSDAQTTFMTNQVLRAAYTTEGEGLLTVWVGCGRHSCWVCSVGP